MGYHGYFINPLEENDENLEYSSNSNLEGNSLGHSFFVTESGYQSQFNFTLSAQYKDFLYLGMSVNSYGIEFNRNDTLYESAYSSESPLISSQFENTLSTVGEGFSMQLGGILKTDNFRIGFSYRTPIWYELNILAQPLIFLQCPLLSPEKLNLTQRKFLTLLQLMNLQR